MVNTLEQGVLYFPHIIQLHGSGINVI